MAVPALVVLVAALGALSTPGSARRPNAALPAAATLFVSPHGSDGNPCTRPAPCKSLRAAAGRAHPGATIRVAGGRYLDSELSNVPRLQCAVAFAGQPGAPRSSRAGLHDRHRQRDLHRLPLFRRRLGRSPSRRRVVVRNSTLKLFDIISSGVAAPTTSPSSRTAWAPRRMRTTSSAATGRPRRPRPLTFSCRTCASTTTT